MLGTDWLGNSSAERALWVLVGINWRTAASWAALMGAQPGEVIIPLYLALIRPHLEYCIPYQHKQDTESWTEFSRGPPRWSGLRALALWAEAEGAGLVQPGERTALGVANSSPHTPVMRLSGRRSQTLHSGTWQEKEKVRDKLKWEVQIWT